MRSTIETIVILLMVVVLGFVISFAFIDGSYFLNREIKTWKKNESKKEEKLLPIEKCEKDRLIIIAIKQFVVDNKLRYFIAYKDTKTKTIEWWNLGLTEVKIFANLNDGEDTYCDLYTQKSSLHDYYIVRFAHLHIHSFDEIR